MPSPVVLKQGHKVGPGRFTLIHELGRGGMGIVWLAHDTHLNEQVALKFLPPEVAADPVALNDLRKETVRSHRLTHPNIIRIHDFHLQPDGVAFISMEYVEGQTLSGWRLQQPGQVLSWEQLAPLVAQLCAALEYAHGEGVIHRDLKPANVMLDSRGRVKLADFGIAAVMTDSMSRMSQRSSSGGTLAYMSPQQLAGKMPSVADDVYALGATIYELLTSKPPFFTGDLTHQILNVPATPVSDRALELGVDNPVPVTVGALLMACLSKEADLRPQSAGMVATWVDVAGSPVHQPTAATPEPVGISAVEAANAARPSSRRWLWTGVAIILGTLMAWMTWILWPKPNAQPTSGSVREIAPGGDATSHTSMPKRLLLVTVTAGFRHTSIPACQTVMDELAREDGRFAFDPVRTDTEMAAKMTAAALQGYAGCVFLNSTGDLPLPDKPAFLNWVKGGKAVVALHAAIDSFKGKNPRDPFTEMLGGEMKGHVGQVTVDIRNRDSTHPACQPLASTWRVLDEIYLVNGFDPAASHVLLSLDRDPKSKTLGEYPIAWTRNYDAGRVFVSLLGHREEMWSDVTFQKHVVGGLEWVLGLNQPDNAAKPQARASERYTNSLGMVFVPVPGTDVKFSIWETRVQDFERFVNATGRDMNPPMTDIPGGGPSSKGSYNWRNPGFEQTGNHPVVGVTWHDAQAFCAWLTSQEQLAGTLPTNKAYRLPTDAEWSRAVGTDEYPWSGPLPPPTGTGNYASVEFNQAVPNSQLVVITNYYDGFAFAAPVGSFVPNRHGLYDLSGNVWEWCEDVYRPEMNTLEARQKYAPFNDPSQTKRGNRVLRGASWFNEYTWIDMLRSSFRHVHEMQARDSRVGFRVVLSSEASTRYAEPTTPIKSQAGFVNLFNGRDFTGWTFSDSSPQKRSWSIENATLVNRGDDRARACGIFTDQLYGNFMLSLEFKLPPRGNSGVYLRGRHEIQLIDDAGDRTPKITSTGGVYKEVVPRRVASKPAGEWQTLEVSLIDDRVTVTLNGVLVIEDAQLGVPYRPPIPAGDRNAPGPIYLQGDSGSVSFRNLRIKSLP